MKQAEKIALLKINHFKEWNKTFDEVDIELSKQQPYVCVCGKLATGFHESRCTKFQNKVKSETVKRLKHLLKKNENKNIKS